MILEIKQGIWGGRHKDKRTAGLVGIVTLHLKTVLPFLSTYG